MATKYMCVSEDEIAFWGCLFPKTDRMPRNMVKMEYAGKPLRIDVFDYDLSIRYRCCSIEQVFTEDEMHNVPEWEGLIPKRVMKEEKNMESQDQINKGMRAKNHCVRGYKMAWYGFMESNPDKIAQFLHSALVFSRCFFFPTGEKYLEVHASRVQNLFGVHGLTRKTMSEKLYSYDDGEFQFPHLVLALKMKGVELMNAMILRAWCARAISPNSIARILVRDNDAAFMRVCEFCIMSPISPFNTILKVGGKWCQVQVQVSSTSEHLGADALEVLGDVSLSRIDMSLGHRVKLVSISGISTGGITYLRVLKFAHQYFRGVRMGTAFDSKEATERVLRALKLCVATHKWNEQELSTLYRVMRMIDTHTNGLFLNEREAVQRFEYFTQFLENAEGIEDEERRAVLKRLDTLKSTL